MLPTDTATQEQDADFKNAQIRLLLTRLQEKVKGALLVDAPAPREDADPDTYANNVARYFEQIALEAKGKRDDHFKRGLDKRLAALRDGVDTITASNTMRFLQELQAITQALPDMLRDYEICDELVPPESIDVDVTDSVSQIGKRSRVQHGLAPSRVSTYAPTQLGSVTASQLASWMGELQQQNRALDGLLDIIARTPSTVEEAVRFPNHTAPARPNETSSHGSQHSSPGDSQDSHELDATRLPTASATMSSANQYLHEYGEKSKAAQRELAAIENERTTIADRWDFQDEVTTASGEQYVGAGDGFDLINHYGDVTEALESLGLANGEPESLALLEQALQQFKIDGDLHKARESLGVKQADDTVLVALQALGFLNERQQLSDAQQSLELLQKALSFINTGGDLSATLNKLMGANTETEIFAALDSLSCLNANRDVSEAKQRLEVLKKVLTYLQTPDNTAIAAQVVAYLKPQAQCVDLNRVLAHWKSKVSLEFLLQRAEDAIDLYTEETQRATGLYQRLEALTIDDLLDKHGQLIMFILHRTSAMLAKFEAGVEISDLDLAPERDFRVDREYQMNFQDKVLESLDVARRTAAACRHTLVELLVSKSDKTRTYELKDSLAHLVTRVDEMTVATEEVTNHNFMTEPLRDYVAKAMELKKAVGSLENGLNAIRDGLVSEGMKEEFICNLFALHTIELPDEESSVRRKVLPNADYLVETDKLVERAHETINRAYAKLAELKAQLEQAIAAIDQQLQQPMQAEAKIAVLDKKIRKLRDLRDVIVKRESLGTVVPGAEVNLQQAREVAAGLTQQEVETTATYYAEALAFARSVCAKDYTAEGAEALLAELDQRTQAMDALHAEVLQVASLGQQPGVFTAAGREALLALESSLRSTQQKVFELLTQTEIDTSANTETAVASLQEQNIHLFALMNHVTLQVNKGNISADEASANLLKNIHGQVANNIQNIAKFAAEYGFPEFAVDLNVDDGANAVATIAEHTEVLSVHMDARWRDMVEGVRAEALKFNNFTDVTRAGLQESKLDLGQALLSEDDVINVVIHVDTALAQATLAHVKHLKALVPAVLLEPLAKTVELTIAQMQAIRATRERLVGLQKSGVALPPTEALRPSLTEIDADYAALAAQTALLLRNSCEDELLQGFTEARRAPAHTLVSQMIDLRSEVEKLPRDNFYSAAGMTPYVDAIDGDIQAVHAALVTGEIAIPLKQGFNPDAAGEIVNDLKEYVAAYEQKIQSLEAQIAAIDSLADRVGSSKALQDYFAQAKAKLKKAIAQQSHQVCLEIAGEDLPLPNDQASLAEVTNQRIAAIEKIEDKVFEHQQVGEFAEELAAINQARCAVYLQHAQQLVKIQIPAGEDLQAYLPLVEARFDQLLVIRKQINDIQNELSKTKSTQQVEMLQAIDTIIEDIAQQLMDIDGARYYEVPHDFVEHDGARAIHAANNVLLAAQIFKHMYDEVNRQAIKGNNNLQTLVNLRAQFRTDLPVKLLAARTRVKGLDATAQQQLFAEVYSTQAPLQDLLDPVQAAKASVEAVTHSLTMPYEQRLQRLAQVFTQQVLHLQGLGVQRQLYELKQFDQTLSGDGIDKSIVGVKADEQKAIDGLRQIAERLSGELKGLEHTVVGKVEMIQQMQAIATGKLSVDDAKKVGINLEKGQTPTLADMFRAMFVLSGQVQNVFQRQANMMAKMQQSLLAPLQPYAKSVEQHCPTLITVCPFDLAQQRSDFVALETQALADIVTLAVNQAQALVSFSDYRAQQLDAQANVLKNFATQLRKDIAKLPEITHFEPQLASMHQFVRAQVEDRRDSVLRELAQCITTAERSGDAEPDVSALAEALGLYAGVEDVTAFAKMAQQVVLNDTWRKAVEQVIGADKPMTAEELAPKYVASEQASGQSEAEYLQREQRRLATHKKMLEDTQTSRELVVNYAHELHQVYVEAEYMRTLGQLHGNAERLLALDFAAQHADATDIPTPVKTVDDLRTWINQQDTDALQRKIADGSLRTHMGDELYAAFEQYMVFDKASKGKIREHYRRFGPEELEKLNYNALSQHASELSQRIEKALQAWIADKSLAQVQGYFIGASLGDLRTQLVVHFGTSEGLRPAERIALLDYAKQQLKATPATVITPMQAFKEWIATQNPAALQELIKKGQLATHMGEAMYAAFQQYMVFDSAGMQDLQAYYAGDGQEHAEVFDQLKDCAQQKVMQIQAELKAWLADRSFADLKAAIADGSLAEAMGEPLHTDMLRLFDGDQQFRANAYPPEVAALAQHLGGGDSANLAERKAAIIRMLEFAATQVDGTPGILDVDPEYAQAVIEPLQAWLAQQTPTQVMCCFADEVAGVTMEPALATAIIRLYGKDKLMREESYSRAGSQFVATLDSLAEQGEKFSRRIGEQRHALLTTKRDQLSHMATTLALAGLANTAVDVRDVEAVDRAVDELAQALKPIELELGRLVRPVDVYCTDKVQVQGTTPQADIVTGVIPYQADAQRLHELQERMFVAWQAFMQTLNAIPEPEPTASPDTRAIATALNKRAKQIFEASDMLPECRLAYLRQMRYQLENKNKSTAQVGLYISQIESLANCASELAQVKQSAETTPLLRLAVTSAQTLFDRFKQAPDTYQQELLDLTELLQTVAASSTAPATLITQLNALTLKTTTVQALRQALNCRYYMDQLDTAARDGNFQAQALALLTPHFSACLAHDKYEDKLQTLLDLHSILQTVSEAPSLKGFSDVFAKVKTPDLQKLQIPLRYEWVLAQIKAIDPQTDFLRQVESRAERINSNLQTEPKKYANAMPELIALLGIVNQHHLQPEQLLERLEEFKANTEVVAKLQAELSCRVLVEQLGINNQLSDIATEVTTLAPSAITSLVSSSDLRKLAEILEDISENINDPRELQKALIRHDRSLQPTPVTKWASLQDFSVKDIGGSMRRLSGGFSSTPTSSLSEHLQAFVQAVWAKVQEVQEQHPASAAAFQQLRRETDVRSRVDPATQSQAGDGQPSPPAREFFM